MSAYQLLKQYQDEVERMTGLRPDITIHFHSAYGLSEMDSRLLRNAMVNDSNSELSPSEVPLKDEGTSWTVFRAQDKERDISLSVHGPHTKETEQCGA